MGHPALGVDVFWDLQVLVSGEVRVGSGEEEEDEALEVVVGGAGGDGQTRHAGEDPHDVLGVHPELAQQLDSGVEAPLTHDRQGGAEVGLAPIGVSSSLQQQSGALPVLVDQRYEQRGLSLQIATMLSQ